MQVEKLVVGGRGINFEIAGVQQHAQRRVDSQRHAIHQAVRHLNGMNGERPNAKTLAGADFIQL